jgi:hypothetical protein
MLVYDAVDEEGKDDTPTLLENPAPYLDDWRCIIPQPYPKPSLPGRFMTVLAAYAARATPWEVPYVGGDAPDSDNTKGKGRLGKEEKAEKRIDLSKMFEGKMMYLGELAWVDVQVWNKDDLMPSPSFRLLFLCVGTPVM